MVQTFPKLCSASGIFEFGSFGSPRSAVQDRRKERRESAAKQQVPDMSGPTASPASTIGIQRRSESHASDGDVGSRSGILDKSYADFH